MSQHDYDLADAAGSALRADLNNALAAIVTLNSGATAPSATFPYMLWLDTTANRLKMRNSADTAWLTLPLDVQTSSKVPDALTVAGAITAAGLIESTVNGFKYPDGTTQTTASEGRIIQLVRAEELATVQVAQVTWYNLLSQAITLNAATNKVLVCADLRAAMDDTLYAGMVKLTRTATDIYVGNAAGSRERVSGALIHNYDDDGANDRELGSMFLLAVDTPGTTGPHTYYVKVRCTNAAGTLNVNRTVDDDDDTDHPRAASSLTLLEYAV